MNTDLNDYHYDNYEKYSIHETDEDNIEIIDDDEAIHKDTVIQLIKKMPMYGNNVYKSHPTKTQLYLINHWAIHNAFKRLILDLYLMSHTQVLRQIYFVKSV